MLELTGQITAEGNYTRNLGRDFYQVLILASPPLLVQGIRLTLEKTGNFKVVGETGCWQQAVRLAEKLKPELTLIDIDLPEENGLEAGRLIKSLGIRTKIMALSSCQNNTQLLEAIRMGASAYISAEADPLKLVEMVRQVAQGQNLIADSLSDKPEILCHLLKHFQEQPPDTDQTFQGGLTSREIEVLQHLAQGASNKEIARNLKISQQTAKNHVNNIFKKLKVDRRTKAVLIAIENGWIESISFSHNRMDQRDFNRASSF